MTPAEFLTELFEAAASRPLRFGQLRIREISKLFLIHHVDDEVDAEELQPLATAAEIRAWTEHDNQGNHRILSTAPTLKSGFVYRASDIASLVMALEAFYPETLTNWMSYAQNETEAVPLRQALIEQAADFPKAAQITDAMANKIMRDTCSKGCLRTIAWPLSRESPVSKLTPGRGEIPMICTRACSLAAEHANELASVG